MSEVHDTSGEEKTKTHKQNPQEKILLRVLLQLSILQSNVYDR